MCMRVVVPRCRLGGCSRRQAAGSRCIGCCTTGVRKSKSGHDKSWERDRMHVDWHGEMGGVGQSMETRVLLCMVLLQLGMHQLMRPVLAPPARTGGMALRHQGTLQSRRLVPGTALVPRACLALGWRNETHDRVAWHQGDMGASDAVDGAGPPYRCCCLHLCKGGGTARTADLKN